MDGRVRVWVGVMTSDPAAVGNLSPGCQTRAERAHEQVATGPRDLPRGRDPVGLGVAEAAVEVR